VTIKSEFNVVKLTHVEKEEKLKQFGFTEKEINHFTEVEYKKVFFDFGNYHSKDLKTSKHYYRFSHFRHNTRNLV
jgi:hypothetical protein